MYLVILSPFYISLFAQIDIYNFYVSYKSIYFIQNHILFFVDVSIFRPKFLLFFI